MSEERRDQPTISGGFTPEAENQFVRIFSMIMERFGTVVPRLTGLPSSTEPLKPSEEDEKIIEKFMELMDEEIEKYAKDLIRMEIRDKILSKGPVAIVAIKEAIKKDKRPKLKRKKGCIFIQFGEGTPEDPIDEILIAST